jgi:photosystem II stability/assembly factor-like uncharacterized protein
MKKIVLLLLIFASPTFAMMNFTMDEAYNGLNSNSVIEIAYDSAGIWLGTAGGASYTTDNGQTWLTFSQGSGLPSNGTSALAATLFNGTPHVWVASSHIEYYSGERIDVGDGLSHSTDYGQTWELFDYAEDSLKEASWYNMLAWDLDMYRDDIYAACFAGGLIRSLDNGANWENLFLNAADSSDYVLNIFSRYSNRYFSVKTDATLPDTISIWGGTAAGINRFVFRYANYVTGAKQDTAWQIYFNPDDTTITDEQRLPGNHVVALGINEPDGVAYIWAACRPVDASQGERYAVAYSTDYGAIWTTVIEQPAWDFDFIGDTVVVATDDGLYISNGNDYADWNVIREVRDYDNYRYFLGSRFYAVETVGSYIWGAGADGTVLSTDGGVTWTVFRSQLQPDDHYAYPTPFSPIASTRQGTTIHYKPPAAARVTIKIYDFNLDLVKTVIDNQYRPGGVEIDSDIWDGENDEGELVANGIYFYNIKLDSGEDWWGKVAVIK